MQKDKPEWNSNLKQHCKELKRWCMGYGMVDIRACQKCNDYEEPIPKFKDVCRIIKIYIKNIFK